MLQRLRRRDDTGQGPDRSRRSSWFSTPNLRRMFLAPGRRAHGASVDTSNEPERRSPLHPNLDSEPRKQPESETIEPEDMDDGHRDHGHSSHPKSPTYVAPIPEIGKLGKVAAVSSDGIAVSPSRPQLSLSIGSLLVGRVVDGSGEIVDDETGQVLARAGGDLPSIVGRAVSNREGDILGKDGELLGYVADVEIEPRGGPAQPRNLSELMGHAAGLMVDHQGNILDAGGNLVGRFLDNNNPLHLKEREERAEAEQEAGAKGQAPVGQSPDNGSGKEPVSPTADNRPAGEQGEQARRPRRTEEEKRQKAEAWRKENPSESPSDIFLDVKSTTEGIQLIIRIPTVFGSGQTVRPNITIS